MILKHPIFTGFRGLTGCQQDPRDRGVTPTSRGVAPPSTMLDKVTGNHDRSEAAGDEGSLFSHAELAIGAVSSIMRDSDLRRVGALPVEEALALLL